MASDRERFIDVDFDDDEPEEASAAASSREDDDEDDVELHGQSAFT
jgi:hypothetical protein